MMVVCGVVLPIYACRRLGISLGGNLRLVWLPAFAGCLPTVAVIGMWQYFSPPASWLGIGMVVVSSVAMTAFGSWFISMTPVERERMTQTLLPVGLRLRER